MRFVLFPLVLASCATLPSASSSGWKVTSQANIYTAVLTVGPSPAELPITVSVVSPVETVDGSTTTSSQSYGTSTTPTLYSKGFAIVIKNNSDATVAVEWDRWALVDQKGSTQRLVHSGIRYIARNEAQVPSVIAPHSKLADTIVPADAVSYLNRNWTILPYLPMESGKFDLKLVVGFSIDGKAQSVVLDLPVEVECRHQEATSAGATKRSC